MAIASMWAFMATLSTPTLLFCVLNLVIATIFIASSFNSHNHSSHNSPSQLARQPSLLQRVKSIDLSSLYHTVHTPEESHDEHMVQYDPTRHNSPSQLNRSPSFLQRVKSIDLSFSSFYTAPVDQLHEHQIDSLQNHDDSVSQLTRVPSILDRVKSFKLPSLLNNSDNHSGETLSSSLGQRSDVDLGPHGQDPVVDDNVKSDVSKDSGMVPATFMKKSRSEKRVTETDDEKENLDLRRPATMKESVRVHDECVDAKADDFIKMFKQQLILQRLDSLRRFRDIMTRGATSG